MPCLKNVFLSLAQYHSINGGKVCESLTVLQHNIQGSTDVLNFIAIPWGNHFVKFRFYLHFEQDVVACLFWGIKISLVKCNSFYILNNTSKTANMKNYKCDYTNLNWNMSTAISLDFWYSDYLYKKVKLLQPNSVKTNISSWKIYINSYHKYHYNIMFIITLDAFNT